MTANANPEKLACTIKYPVLDISNQLITDIVQIYHAALVGFYFCIPHYSCCPAAKVKTCNAFLGLDPPVEKRYL